MSHSTTYRRQAQRLAAQQAVEQRAAFAAKAAEHYTDADRKVADELEARELFRAFLAEEI